jgi:hypothetical protein
LVESFLKKKLKCLPSSIEKLLKGIVGVAL